MIKGKKVSGEKFAAVDERYKRKRAKKEDESMDTAGIANSLRKSQKRIGKSSKPGVKPQKMGKLSLKIGQVY